MGSRPSYPLAMHRDHDLAIVGAGIVGLAVARELLVRRPGLRVAVLDKQDEVGFHQTGHNSGVLHAGIYYAPGSLKAKLCVEGAARLYDWCDEHDVAYERCGKLIVATDASELPKARRARAPRARQRRPRPAPPRRRRPARGRAALRRRRRAALAEHGDRRLPGRRALVRARRAGARGRAAARPRGDRRGARRVRRRAHPLARPAAGGQRDLLRRPVGRPPRGEARRAGRPAHRPVPRRVPEAEAGGAAAGARASSTRCPIPSCRSSAST